MHVIAAQKNVESLHPPSQVVLILGTGAFACEAMEAAHRNGAEHIYLISRRRKRYCFTQSPISQHICWRGSPHIYFYKFFQPSWNVIMMVFGHSVILVSFSAQRNALCDVTCLRHRWVLPFSRQFTTTFVSYAPIIPWRWKMAMLKSYLSSNFYRVSGIQHVIPTGEDMDYTGTTLLWNLDLEVTMWAWNVVSMLQHTKHRCWVQSAEHVEFHKFMPSHIQMNSVCLDAL